jgi:hypothetical protein
MGDVVNLNKFRKRKTKAEAAKRADTNRTLHGRTPIERVREALKKRRSEAQIEGARMKGDPEEQ